MMMLWLSRQCSSKYVFPLDQQNVMPIIMIMIKIMIMIMIVPDSHVEKDLLKIKHQGVVSSDVKLH